LKNNKAGLGGRTLERGTMKKLSRAVSVAGLFLGFALAASAEQVEGVLMDKMCSAKAAKEGQQAAAMHSRDCALMPDCVKSGFGVFTSDNRFLTFDAAGNRMAQQALQQTDKKENLRVRVNGNVQGDAIKVSDLKLI
jgi:hypothetical protein